MKRRPFLLLALLAACGGESTGPTATVEGTWTLQTVNHGALPFTLAQTDTSKVELVGDVYAFSGTGSFTTTETLRITTNGVANTQSVSNAGTYVGNGSAVTLHFNSNGSTGTFAWSGNIMTASDGTFSYLFTK